MLLYLLANQTLNFQYKRPTLAALFNLNVSVTLSYEIFSCKDLRYICHAKQAHYIIPMMVKHPR